MKGIATSFHGLTAQVQGVERVEVPIVQRDYAQGRTDKASERIREDFLSALHTALTSNTPLSLDFIFGDVRNGTFTPLDGQQRLTTLFLLHRYLAWRAGLPCEGPWTHFSYATRASARAFCEALVAHPLDTTTPRVSKSINDQPWFLSTWRHDPTVQAMLVMLDAVHTRFANVDAVAAWQRLTHPDTYAVQFHLLPIEGIGDPVDLYLKMNARGKPLTPFEHFKARFERLLEDVDPVLAKSFAEKIDGAWSDMLWPMRGDDNLIDDEFLRYLGFFAECCTWAEQRAPERDVVRRAELAFGPENPKARDNLVALMAALDTWCGTDSEVFFALHFSLVNHETGKLSLFPSVGIQTVNLLDACCRDYDVLEGTARRFSLERTLLLDAVLIHRTEQTQDFSRRLRMLRNAIEANYGILRSEEMPTWFSATRDFIRGGDLEVLRVIHARQVDDELRKAKLLSAHPSLADTLFALEDHPLLRGCLTAFDLDPAHFTERADTFQEIFRDGSLRLLLTGALLACGNYIQLKGASTYQLGSSLKERDDVWRWLLGWSPPSRDRIRTALMALLDGVIARQGTMPERLEALCDAWCTDCEATNNFNWRYYLVKYPAMREGASGLYVGRDGNLGNALCMLNKKYLNGYYRDPYLHAMRREVERTGNIAAHIEDSWFRGYEHVPRCMRLPRSGTALRSAGPSLELTPPTQPAHAAAYTTVCAAHGVHNNTLPIPQKQHDGQSVDAVDRVQLGAKLLRALVDAGL